MKKVSVIVVLAVCMVTMVGCSGSEMKTAGFLSDYSNLQEESASCLRYVDKEAAPKYSKFIVDSVQVRFASDAKSKDTLTNEQIGELTDYMHNKVIKAIDAAGLKTAYQPGPGIARVRIALTDIEKTDAINMLPQASLLGAGVGGATMEAEIIDSVTSKQVGAIVQSKDGSKVPFSNLGDWTAAKSVMDAWAERFQKTLEAIHQ